MMALVKSTDKVQVFDDFLPEDQFQEIWKFVQAQSYISPQTSGEWLKIWRLSDGHPLIGTLIWCLSQRPLNNPFDYLLEPVVELAGQNASIRDWQDVSCRVFLYPSGTKHSWSPKSRLSIKCFPLRQRLRTLIMNGKMII